MQLQMVEAWYALSDGSSASQCRHKKGPTAVLLSNAKSKNLGYKERALWLLNIKLSPACVKGEAEAEKIISFIKGAI